jgi:methionyl aminopeptidase
MENNKPITLHNNEWLVRQKYAGEVVAELHRYFFSKFISRSNITTKSLDAYARDFIISKNCQPTFYKYKGFPGNICISIDNALVHGFAEKEIEIQEGNVVKIDIGATFEGAIADCAFTYMYGTPKDPRIPNLFISCQNALNKSIEQVYPGNKTGAIGSVIYEEGKNNNFGVITAYGGHGLDYNKLHTPPFISNKAKLTDGIVIEAGMALAIEPMFVLGDNINTRVSAWDKWSVYTKDIGVHFEHSVTLDQEGNRHIIANHGLDAKEFFNAN